MQKDYGCYEHLVQEQEMNLPIAEFCNGDCWIIFSLDKSE